MGLYTWARSIGWPSEMPLGNFSTSEDLIFIEATCIFEDYIYAHRLTPVRVHIRLISIPFESILPVIFYWVFITCHECNCFPFSCFVVHLTPVTYLLTCPRKLYPEYACRKNATAARHFCTLPLSTPNSTNMESLIAPQKSKCDTEPSQCSIHSAVFRHGNFQRT